MPASKQHTQTHFVSAKIRLKITSRQLLAKIAHFQSTAEQCSTS